jgi:HK97 family phage major capsid protein
MSKLISPEVAKVLNALGGNVGQNHIETNPEKIKQAEIAAAIRLEHAQKMEASGISKAEIEQYMKNANELMHTGNTGYGKELIPVEVLTQQVIDLVPKYSTFLPTLPGFHGTGLAISQKVPVIGEVGFFKGNTEPTTGAQAIPQPSNRLATGEVQINQAPLLADVFITKRELNYSIVDLEALIKQRLAESLARTMESMLINADIETGSTGNINSDDQAPATTFATTGGAADHRLLLDHGLRELAINGSGLTVNAGALDMTDFIAVMNLLGDLASNPADLLWLFNRSTYNKALTLDAFAKANERGLASTIAGNAISNVFGADLFIARDLLKSEADGKQSATPGNNTLGQFLLFHKAAIQHGYGQPFEIEVTRVAGKGVQLTATCEWGFAIAQLLAGSTDSVVGLARNITL